MSLILHNTIDQKLETISKSIEILKEQHAMVIDNMKSTKDATKNYFKMAINSLENRANHVISNIEDLSLQQLHQLNSQIADLQQAKGSLTILQQMILKGQADAQMDTDLCDDTMNSVSAPSPLCLPTFQVGNSDLINLIEDFGSVKISQAEGFPSHDPVGTQNIRSSSVKTSVNPKTDFSENTFVFDLPQWHLEKSNWLSPDTNKDVPIRKSDIALMSTWLQSLKPFTKTPEHDNQTLSTDINDLSKWKLQKCNQTIKIKVPELKGSWLHSKKFQENQENSKNHQMQINDQKLATSDVVQCCQSRSRNDSDSSSIEVVSYSDMLDCDIEKMEMKNESSLDSFFWCQANEPCTSPTYCICDGLCIQLATEKASQSHRWLSNQSESNRWLAKPNEPSVCYKANQITDMEDYGEKITKNDVLNQLVAIYGSQNSQWLISGNSQSQNLEPIVKLPDFENNSENWLNKIDFNHFDNKCDYNQFNELKLETDEKSTINNIENKDKYKIDLFAGVNKDLNSFLSRKTKNVNKKYSPYEIFPNSSIVTSNK